jgi:hypothetical protein
MEGVNSTMIRTFLNVTIHPQYNNNMIIKKKKSGSVSSESKKRPGRALVAHACNPSYSGGRDQVDNSSKPAQANSSARLYLQKLYHKKWVLWSGSR